MPVIRYNPQADPNRLIAQGLGDALSGFTGALEEQREFRRRNTDVAAIKQWVDGGMEGPPPATGTEIGQNLAGSLVMKQAAEAIADPGGRTLRLERMNLRRDAKLRRAQTGMYDRAGTPGFSATGRPIAATAEKGFTATDLGGFRGVLGSAIDSVENVMGLGRGRAEEKFLESFTNNVIADPTTKWNNLNERQRIQVFRMYESEILKQSKTKAGHEIAYNAASEQVRKFKQELFGDPDAGSDIPLEPSNKGQAVGPASKGHTQRPKTLPPGLPASVPPDLASSVFVTVSPESKDILLEAQRKFQAAQQLAKTSKNAVQKDLAEKDVEFWTDIIERMILGEPPPEPRLAPVIPELLGHPDPQYPNNLIGAPSLKTRSSRR